MCVTGILITAMHMGAHKNHFCRKGNWRMDSFVTTDLAHRALNTLLEEGCMTKKSAYIWLQNKPVREKDMHIAKFSCITVRKQFAYVMTS